MAGGSVPEGWQEAAGKGFPRSAPARSTPTGADVGDVRAGAAGEDPFSGRGSAAPIHNQHWRLHSAETGLLRGVMLDLPHTLGGGGYSVGLAGWPAPGKNGWGLVLDRKSVVEGKSVDVGGGSR